MANEDAILYKSGQKSGLELKNNLILKQSKSERGIANGYAPLDVDNDIPLIHLKKVSTGQLQDDLLGISVINKGLTANQGYVLKQIVDGKAASTHGHAISDVTNLQTELSGKAASTHGHSISDVTNLQTELSGKAASTHGHSISDVTNLQNELNNKRNVSDSYTKTEVDNLVGSTASLPGTINKNILVNSLDTGFIYLNGGTIGNSSSGSSTRSNSDTLNLFTFLYNNFDGSQLPLFTSAGVLISETTRTTYTDATAAFNANCRLSIPLIEQPRTSLEQQFYKPIGEYFPVETGLGIIPPNGKFIELTKGLSQSSGNFNYNLLSSSSDTIVNESPIEVRRYTNTINNSNSPLNSKTITLINSIEVMNTAGTWANVPAVIAAMSTSGSFLKNQGQGHHHTWTSYNITTGSGLTSGGDNAYTPNSTALNNLVIGGSISDGTYGTPRIGTQTRQDSFTVKYFMRVLYYNFAQIKL